MNTKILVRERPSRAIALRTDTHVLILRPTPLSSASQGPNASSTSSLQSQLTGGNSGAPGSGLRCVVELVEAEKADLSDFRTFSHSVFGTLGLITVDNDVFLCVVSGATQVATVRPGETVHRILSVDFHCLSSSLHDHLLYDDINLYPTHSLDEDGYEQGHQGHHDYTYEHPCLSLKKLLSGGSFYFSVDFDLTSRLQDRTEDASTFDFDTFDKGYLWNSYMIKPLVDFRSRLSNQERKDLDSTHLLTSAIRGFASTITVPASSSPARVAKSGVASTLTLISRLSCKRAGTRFNARGIDDDGNVANFVETETIFWSPSKICFSYSQVRGSVPVFWEQAAGLLPGQQKIQITRSPQATQPAFDKHFEELEIKYGPIHVVNLLSKEKQGEVELSQRFKAHIGKSSLNARPENSSSSDHRLLRMTEYDFHAETRGVTGYEAAGMIQQFLEESLEGFGFCLIEGLDDSTRHVMILQQQGVFRTNCLDCLDRTNLVQTNISQMALEMFLGHRGERTNSDFLARHGSLWADNGDALSRIYAGTGALKSSFTRTGKMSIAGALADARKSATRMYINNFADTGRQKTMDMLLGRLLGQAPVYLFDPVNEYVISELSRRAGEFTSTKDITIWAGTLNLNGRANGVDEDLSPWLCPPVDKTLQNPSIIAVGFQEIVELSPQQIMSTEPTRRQAWEKAVKKTLNNNARAAGADEYVLLRGGQLVGTSLSIFVKKKLLSHIKSVEGGLKKTGMSGMAGNKGAVAIRMEIDNTSLCFVTAHLAAGFANYEERNRDYKTISNGLRFNRNRPIDDHDTVIWLGDFNYRIGLGDDKVRHLAHQKDFSKLYENDQLNLQMVAGLTFPYYSEARINFMPTYKYDIGTDTYDTSDKGRIPAWTDRILRKGGNLRQHTYATAPLRFSDHRPVYAAFSCTINVIDEAVKDALSRDIYSQRKEAIQTAAPLKTLSTETDDDDDLLGYEPIEPGLPPASSEKKRWWIDNGMPARARVQPPGDGYIPNQSRASNPFTPSDLPEWVKVQRPRDSAAASGNASSAALVEQAPQQPPRKETARIPITLPPQSQSQSHADGADDDDFINVVAPSRASTVVRKPAPPVPTKKPSLQASPSPALQPSQSARSPPRGSTSSPKPPQERNGSRSLLDDDDDETPAPKLPPRRGTSKGLMDDEEDDAGGMGGWVPLKPS